MTILDDAAYRGDAPITTNSSPSERIDAADVSQGNWPRLIYLPKHVEEALHNWLEHEITDFYKERGSLLDDWMKWQTLYWAEPATTERNFPFKRAANIVIPLAAIAVGSIHYRMMNTLFSVEPFWSSRPRSKEWIPFSKPIEEFLQSEVESNESLKVYEFANVSSLELIKLGTGVAKSGFEKIIKKSLRDVGDTQEEIFVPIRQGATLARVPLNNFIMRLVETDPQVAPLVGEKHRFTWARMKQYAQAKRFDADVLEEVKTHWRSIQEPEDANDGSDVDRHTQNLAHAEPIDSEVFDVYEIWCACDVDGDGWDEEIVVDWHRDSRKFLSIRYNWYNDLHRPYRIGNLIPVEGVWAGIGICKLTNQFQNEVTTIRRQRLDNATLANMAQIVLRKGMGYGPGEPIFPGKMWFVDDPLKDIREFKLSEVYPSSVQNEMMVTRDWEKLVGANDIVLGVTQTGTPGTATGDLTRLAEGNKGFDYYIKQVKRWYGPLGLDILSNYQTFGTGDLHWLAVGDDGVYIEQMLTLPSSIIRRGLILDLTVTDSITNRDTEQAKWMQLFQILTGYYDRVLQLAQVITQFSGDPTALFTLAQKALEASAEAGKRLMENFGEPDADRFSLLEEPSGNGQGIRNGNGGIGSIFGGTQILPPGRGLSGPTEQGGNRGNSQNGGQSRMGNVPSNNGRS